jgi:hypothetical protein
LNKNIERKSKMMDDKELKQQFEEEMAKAASNPIFSPADQRKKFVIYMVRTAIAAGLIVYFWEYQWVRWALYIYIPLNLISLGSIFIWPYFLKKKIERTKRNMMD